LHDGSGRFGKGNSFGKGNPQLKRMHALRAKLLDCATDEDLERIVKKLAALAAAGDVAAARLYLEYVVGKAPQAIELSGPGGDPIETLAASAAVREQATAELSEWRQKMADQVRALVSAPGVPSR
jgi:hypothetical protein